MDEPLARAFHYPIPSRFERALFRGALKLRARLLRFAPARSKPKWASQLGYYRTYPAGYDIDHLGTFPGGDLPSTPTWIREAVSRVGRGPRLDPRTSQPSPRSS